jgi:hypothetical protein
MSKPTNEKPIDGIRHRIECGRCPWCYKATEFMDGYDYYGCSQDGHLCASEQCNQNDYLTCPLHK